MGMKIDISVSNCHRITNAGPVILLTASNNNSTTITTVAWHMPVSNSPKLIAVSLGTDRFSLKLIESSLSFCINLPDLPLFNELIFCGANSGKNIDKFKETGLTPKRCNIIDTYYIEECIAHIECKVFNIHETGDHKIVIGTAVASYANENIFNENGIIDINKIQLIHHLGSNNFGILKSMNGYEE